MHKKTIYVGFDGTLCVNKGIYPGVPIKPMVDRVKRWIQDGHTVKIFTARVDQETVQAERVNVLIVTDWCEREGLVNLDGSALVITNRKGRDCDEIWDDRAVSVNEYGYYTSMRKTAAAVDYTQAAYQKHMPVPSQIYDTLLKNGHLREAAKLQQGPHGTTFGFGYSHTPGTTAAPKPGPALTSGRLAATNEVDTPQDTPPLDEPNGITITKIGDKEYLVGFDWAEPLTR